MCWGEGVVVLARRRQKGVKGPDSRFPIHLLRHNIKKKGVSELDHACSQITSPSLPALGSCQGPRLPPPRGTPDPCSCPCSSNRASLAPPFAILTVLIDAPDPGARSLVPAPPT